MRAAILVLAFIGILCGCGIGGKATSTAAADALRQCAASQAVSTSQILYTGPTGAGPGSEWKQISSNLLVIWALPSDIWAPPNPSMFAPVVAAGPCSVQNNTKIDLRGTLGADIKTLPVSGTLKAGLASAKVLSVTADGFQWEWVKLGVFETELSKLPGSSKYRSQEGNSLMAAIGMLKVTGYVATLDVTDSATLNLGASYSGPLPKELTGSLSAGVDVTYDASGHLQLKVPSETYVAGVFRPLVAGTGVVGAPPMDDFTEYAWSPKAIELQGGRM